MIWDIFCRVIDNWGDIGICWRLSADLAQRNQQVRLWVDDASALAWMAPGALQGLWPGVQVINWSQASAPDVLQAQARADVWIESFGCELPAPFVAHFAAQTGQRPVWINLEYLSAEAYVERSHGLPSPVLHGPAAGWTKHFFYPGFTPRTGGLLRESVPMQRPDAQPTGQFLQDLPIPMAGHRCISLFCYEPPLLRALMDSLAQGDTPTLMLVTQGRAQEAVRSLWGDQTAKGKLQWVYLPWLTQAEYDHLLAACDLNFVRGEDSVVRALWAGQPFVWHIYPQSDGADEPKLEAFLECMQFSPAVRDMHRAWNCMPGKAQAGEALQVLQASHQSAWRQEVQAARNKLLQADDLTSQLLQFVQKNR